MVLRSSELHHSLQHLNGMLTTHEAAKQLDLSYWHFMHLVEAGRIQGVRVVDRWLFSPDDLADYRRSKYGVLEDMARLALNHPDIGLTEKQAMICRYLLANKRPSDIARTLQQSRQAVHSQISLIREKVSRTQALSSDHSSDPYTSNNTNLPTNTTTTSRRTTRKRSPASIQPQLQA
jgi:excisionase family DNA binding protein